MPNSVSRAARLPRPSRRSRRAVAAVRGGWRQRGHRLWRAFGAVPPPLRIVAAVAAALLVFAAANLVYHVVRKPTEMLFPVSGVLKKPPAETWRQYAPLFRSYATAAVSPELLAALAQVEGAGDPV